MALADIRNIEVKDLTLNRGQIEGLPANPRFVRDQEYETMKRSLIEDPEMLELRECVVVPFGKRYVVICGNTRLRAARELGMKSLPCKVLDPDTPAQKLRAYAIKDNVNYGKNDTDLLANEWEAVELLGWGVELNLDTDEKPKKKAKEKEQPEEDELDEEQMERENFFLSMLNDCLYDSNNDLDIPNLKLAGQAGHVVLPFSGWGAESRQKKGISTYHFYVDDYRFEAIWKDPHKVLLSGCTAVVEPNLSTFDTTPVAWGIMQIYKKRWIARYFQECGIKVYVDLNVSQKFYELNMLGVPKGYNAFATRGYADRLEYLRKEHEIAQRVSGLEIPNMIVYGGGQAVREYCTQHSLIYIEQLMNNKKI